MPVGDIRKIRFDFTSYIRVRMHLRPLAASAGKASEARRERTREGEVKPRPCLSAARA